MSIIKGFSPHLLDDLDERERKTVLDLLGSEEPISIYVAYLDQTGKDAFKWHYIVAFNSFEVLSIYSGDKNFYADKIWFIKEIAQIDLHEFDFSAKAYPVRIFSKQDLFYSNPTPSFSLVFENDEFRNEFVRKLGNTVGKR